MSRVRGFYGSKPGNNEDRDVRRASGKWGWRASPGGPAASRRRCPGESASTSGARPGALAPPGRTSSRLRRRRGPPRRRLWLRRSRGGEATLPDETHLRGGMVDNVAVALVCTILVSTDYRWKCSTGQKSCFVITNSWFMTRNHKKQEVRDSGIHLNYKIPISCSYLCCKTKWHNKANRWELVLAKVLRTIQ